MVWIVTITILWILALGAILLFLGGAAEVSADWDRLQARDIARERWPGTLRDAA